MIKSISILGCTGSIGTQAIEVIRKLNIKVLALASNSNIKLLEDQIREFKPELVSVYDEKSAYQLKQNIKDLDVNIVTGIDGLCEVARFKGSDLVLNSIVGMIGLIPTLEAIEAKKNVALANKETLVAGGELVMKKAKENNVKIIPVDSEHSAIFQCLQGCPDMSFINRLILTASGGPFFNKSLCELSKVTPEQALKHPNWNMGKKVTIDSATMMNKGLEIIEAKWFFDIEVDKIDVLIHRESIVHSLIEYKDNSVIAQLSLPDMRIPIQYAITYPNRCESCVERLDLFKISNLSFFEPDLDTFKCLKACKDAIKRGNLAPAAANGANEEAVRLFLDKKILFTDIADMVVGAMNNQADKEILSVDDIIEADRKAREYVINNVCI